MKAFLPYFCCLTIIIATTAQAISLQEDIAIVFKQYNLNDVFVSKDHEFLAAVSHQLPKISIFNGNSLKFIQTITFKQQVKGDYPVIVRFSPKSQLMLVGTLNGFIYTFVKKQTQAISNFDQIPSNVQAFGSSIIQIQFLENTADQYFAAFKIGYVYTYNIATDKLQLVLNKGISLYSVHYNQFDATFAVGGGIQQIHILQLYNNRFKLLTVFNATGVPNSVINKNREIYCVYLSQTLEKDLNLKASNQQQQIQNSGLILVWDKQTGQLKYQLQSKSIFKDIQMSKNNLYLFGKQFANEIEYFGRNSEEERQWVERDAIVGINPSVCLSSIVDLFTLTNSTQIAKYSMCPKNHYYLASQNKCILCLVQCQRCFYDQIQPSQSNVQDANGVKCYQCKQSYYLKIFSCLKCMAGCTKCQEQQKCDQCSIKDHWISNKGVCECIQGYYQQLNQCLKCNITCSACKSMEQCTKCQAIANTSLVNGRCVCRSSQFINFDFLKCQKCDIYQPFCTLCNNKFSCDQCNSTEHRVIQNASNKCICQQPYFENKTQQKCLLCQFPGCMKCRSVDQCELCDHSAHWISDFQGQCKCQQKYFKVEDFCQRCMLGCLICKNEAENCQACDVQANWELQVTKCKCIQGFQQSDKGQCIKKQQNNNLIWIGIAIGLLGVFCCTILLKRIRKQKKKMLTDQQVQSSQKKLKIDRSQMQEQDEIQQHYSSISNIQKSKRKRERESDAVRVSRKINRSQSINSQEQLYNQVG